MRISEYLEIGKKMKAARKKQRYSQREMAKELGLSFSTYSNYENGYSEPPMEVIRKFCSILRLTEAELFELHISTPKSTHVDTFSDFLAILIDLDRRGLPITSTVVYEKEENILKAHLMLDIKNTQIASFIPDWNSVNAEVEAGLMDEEEYKIWYEKTMKLFHVPIEDYLYPEKRKRFSTT